MVNSRRLALLPAAVLMLAAAGTGALAAEVGRVEVEREGDRYHVQMAARLAVPAQDAYLAFTRFEDLPLINPSVREARVLAREAEVTRIETRLRVCIAIFCPRFTMTQDMAGGVEDEVFTLSAMVVPELSDFRYGLGVWRFAPCGTETCVSFDARLEPGFWIPPLIGRWMMRRALRAEARATSEGIERMARPDSSTTDAD